jgi:UDP-hydrolysing UDP-N-acetyl-D-glucosamine 2-epimerase
LDAAVVAALPFNIPVAHIHGGESTLGAIDDVIRHSITKMSHLHFAATQTYGDRLLALGEESWRVWVTGAPSLDNLQSMELLSRERLAARLDMDLERPFLLVTYHPVTREHEKTSNQILELVAALKDSEFGVLFTYPNADTGNREIIDAITEFTQNSDRASLAISLGSTGYFSAMKHAVAMIGNSSSGIIEAASMELPVVNIGNRQKGRIHGENVIHVAPDRASILAGIKKATSSEFCSSMAGISNPYGDGNAAAKIISALKSVVIDEQLLMKKFPEAVS